MTENIDVVVVSRDTRAATLRCVRSLGGAAALADLVVVDNASSDGTVEAIRSEVPSAIVIEHSVPRGFAASCNLGARAGSAGLVLFLNSDAAARPGALDALAAALAGRAGTVAAGGRLVAFGTDRPQVGFAIRGFPTVAAQIATLAGLERLWPGNAISRRQLALDFDYESTHTTDGQPSGACLLCRRAAFEQVGGFDEAFPFWFEDVDLVRRLGRLGSVLYVHDAVFDHQGGLTVEGRPREELVPARYAGLVRYFDKHGTVSGRLAVRMAVAGAATLRAGAAAARGRRPEARAHLRGASTAFRAAE